MYLSRVDNIKCDLLALMDNVRDYDVPSDQDETPATYIGERYFEDNENQLDFSSADVLRSDDFSRVGEGNVSPVENRQPYKENSTQLPMPAYDPQNSFNYYSSSPAVGVRRVQSVPQYRMPNSNGRQFLEQLQPTSFIPSYDSNPMQFLQDSGTIYPPSRHDMTPIQMISPPIIRVRPPNMQVIMKNGMMYSSASIQAPAQLEPVQYLHVPGYPGHWVESRYVPVHSDHQQQSIGNNEAIFIQRGKLTRPNNGPISNSYLYENQNPMQSIMSCDDDLQFASSGPRSLPNESEHSIENNSSRQSFEEMNEPRGRLKYDENAKGRQPCQHAYRPHSPIYIKSRHVRQLSSPSIKSSRRNTHSSHGDDQRYSEDNRVRYQPEDKHGKFLPYGTRSYEWKGRGNGKMENVWNKNRHEQRARKPQVNRFGGYNNDQFSLNPQKELSKNDKHHVNHWDYNRSHVPESARNNSSDKSKFFPANSRANEYMHPRKLEKKFMPLRSDSSRSILKSVKPSESRKKSIPGKAFNHSAPYLRQHDLRNKIPPLKKAKMTPSGLRGKAASKLLPCTKKTFTPKSPLDDIKNGSSLPEFTEVQKSYEMDGNLHTVAMYGHTQLMKRPKPVFLQRSIPGKEGIQHIEVTLEVGSETFGPVVCRDVCDGRAKAALLYLQQVQPPLDFDCLSTLPKHQISSNSDADTIDFVSREVQNDTKGSTVSESLLDVENMDTDIKMNVFGTNNENGHQTVPLKVKILNEKDSGKTEKCVNFNGSEIGINFRNDPSSGNHSKSDFKSEHQIFDRSKLTENVSKHFGKYDENHGIINSNVSENITSSVDPDHCPSSAGSESCRTSEKESLNGGFIPVYQKCDKNKKITMSNVSNVGVLSSEQIDVHLETAKMTKKNESSEDFCSILDYQKCDEIYISAISSASKSKSIPDKKRLSTHDSEALEIELKSSKKVKWQVDLKDDFSSLLDFQKCDENFQNVVAVAACHDESDNATPHNLSSVKSKSIVNPKMYRKKSNEFLPDTHIRITNSTTVLPAKKGDVPRKTPPKPQVKKSNGALCRRRTSLMVPSPERCMKLSSNRVVCPAKVPNDIHSESGNRSRNDNNMCNLATPNIRHSSGENSIEENCKNLTSSSRPHIENKLEFPTAQKVQMLRVLDMEVEYAVDKPEAKKTSDPSTETVPIEINEKKVSELNVEVRVRKDKKQIVSELQKKGLPMLIQLIDRIGACDKRVLGSCTYSWIHGENGTVICQAMLKLGPYRSNRRTIITGLASDAQMTPIGPLLKGGTLGVRGSATTKNGAKLLACAALLQRLLPQCNSYEEMILAVETIEKARSTGKKTMQEAKESQELKANMLTERALQSRLGMSPSSANVDKIN